MKEKESERKVEKEKEGQVNEQKNFRLKRKKMEKQLRFLHNKNIHPNKAPLHLDGCEYDRHQPGGRYRQKDVNFPCYISISHTSLLQYISHSLSSSLSSSPPSSPSPFPHSPLSYHRKVVWTTPLPWGGQLERLALTILCGGTERETTAL